MPEAGAVSAGVLLRGFARLWGSKNYPPDSVRPDDLAHAEDAVGRRLPDSYRAAVLEVGLPRLTIALLHSIVEQDIDLADISGFLSPTEIVESTVDWRELGLPDHLIAFATDCTGNLFAFDLDGSIWIFDHDYGTIDRLADSFEDWLGDYCLIPYISPDDET
ncbi:MAG: SMI1/KNR4 family protein [Caulobacter sp.]|nr:SMI1/KNR4 family protein [Caulobacter sp.]